MGSKIKKRTVIIFYVPMIAVAIIWDILDGEHESLKVMSDDINPAITVLLVILLAAVAIGISALMSKISERVRDLSIELKRILGDLSNSDICLFAISSGIGEEMLFRGPLLYHAGIVPSTIIFSVLHGFFQKKFIAWSLFALFVGFGLGWICIWTGGLLAPVIAHVIINSVNLYLLNLEKI